jgi:hypothetical protein
LREEDKEEGEDLEKGSHFCFRLYERERRRRKFGRMVLGNSHRELLLLGTLGSGASKPQGFLELGSRRGCS